MWNLKEGTFQYGKLLWLCATPLWIFIVILGMVYLILHNSTIWITSHAVPNKGRTTLPLTQNHLLPGNTFPQRCPRDVAHLFRVITASLGGKNMRPLDGSAESSKINGNNGCNEWNQIPLEFSNYSEQTGECRECLNCTFSPSTFASLHKGRLHWPCSFLNQCYPLVN